MKVEVEEPDEEDWENPPPLNWRSNGQISHTASGHSAEEEEEERFDDWQPRSEDLAYDFDLGRDEMWLDAPEEPPEEIKPKGYRILFLLFYNTSSCE
jgi:hypothetical protein